MVHRLRWRIMDSVALAYPDDAAREARRLKRKHSGDTWVEVATHHRRVRAAGAAVDVWVVVARKPWKGEA